jgi:hypothetical protein
VFELEGPKEMKEGKVKGPTKELNKRLERKEGPKGDYW